ncbi:MAG: methyltransferase domain-containing protein [Gemmatimonadaceae bacterium]
MTTHDAPLPRTKGFVLHSTARYYDLLVWVLTFGRERAFRERTLDLARVAPGESVLDVACGTGSLALAAKRRVGVGGAVHGIDASPEMIAVATAKVRKAGVAVDIRDALAESLPFPDASFDVVLGTLMVHHLPGPTKQASAREMRRVLRPGGRVLLVDFESRSGGKPRGLLDHLHRHGGVRPDVLAALVEDAGMRVVERGKVGVLDLHYVLAEAPAVAP